MGHRRLPSHSGRVAARNRDPPGRDLQRVLRHPPAGGGRFHQLFQRGRGVQERVHVTRGDGKVFFFSPGHETFPVYHDELVKKVIANAVVWADRGRPRIPLGCSFTPPRAGTVRRPLR